MRFLKVYTGKGDGKRVFQFAAGSNELQLIRDAVKLLHEGTPKIMETTALRGRMGNIESTIDRAIHHELDEQKNPIALAEEEMKGVLEGYTNNFPTKTDSVSGGCIMSCSRHCIGSSGGNGAEKGRLV